MALRIVQKSFFVFFSLTAFAEVEQNAKAVIEK
jgi:hypothetical protein